MEWDDVAKDLPGWDLRNDDGIHCFQGPITTVSLEDGVLISLSWIAEKVGGVWIFRQKDRSVKIPNFLRDAVRPQRLADGKGLRFGLGSDQMILYPPNHQLTLNPQHVHGLP